MKRIFSILVAMLFVAGMYGLAAADNTIDSIQKGGVSTLSPTQIGDNALTIRQDGATTTNHVGSMQNGTNAATFTQHAVGALPLANSATLSQTGDTNGATATQTGTDNTADVTQDGDSHLLTSTQTAAGINDLIVSQDGGNGNTAVIDQTSSAGSNSTANLVQSGNTNDLATDQTASGDNELAVTVDGDTSDIDLIQGGQLPGIESASNSADLTVIGDHDVMDITQNSDGANLAVAGQTGDRNSLTVDQTGTTSNNLNSTQAGNDNVIVLTQAGNPGCALINTALLSQIGNDHQMHITQNSAGNNTANCTQN